MIKSSSDHATNTAISSFKKYGVHKSLVHYLALNKFTIPEEFRDCFKQYFLRKWQISYTLGKVKEGKIVEGSTEYIVVYKETTRGRLNVSTNPDCLVSFREPQEDFGIPGYAIIKEC